MLNNIISAVPDDDKKSKWRCMLYIYLFGVDELIENRVFVLDKGWQDYVVLWKTGISYLRKYFFTL